MRLVVVRFVVDTFVGLADEIIESAQIQREGSGQDRCWQPDYPSSSSRQCALQGEASVISVESMNNMVV